MHHFIASLSKRMAYVIIYEMKLTVNDVLPQGL
jgi:hypothetical protein